MLCSSAFQRQTASTKYFGAHRYTGTSQSLATPHWLSMKWRIDFKVATISYKLLSTGQPAYLANSISPHAPGSSLRSSDSGSLYVPRTIATTTCLQVAGLQGHATSPGILPDFFCSRCMSDMYHFNHIDGDFEFKSSIFNYFCDFPMPTRFTPNDQQFSFLNYIKVTKDDDIDPDSNVYNVVDNR